MIRICEGEGGRGFGQLLFYSLISVWLCEKERATAATEINDDGRNALARYPGQNPLRIRATLHGCGCYYFVCCRIR